MKGQGLRYNKGKTRLGLIPQFALEQLGEVLTYGADKYTVKEGGEITVDGANNWKNGMPWMNVVDSLKRHLKAYISGEDFDQESGCLHVGHILTNAAILCEYYKIYPEGDNRPLDVIRERKIALDVDGVLADFSGHWADRHGEEVAEHWQHGYNQSGKWEKVLKDKEFWLSMPSLVNPLSLSFEPDYYITARNIPKKWTEEWIAMNGLPTAPVISGVKNKVEAMREYGVDWLVDDKYSTFRDVNKEEGLACFLFTQPHNEKYNVGFKRIDCLSDLMYNSGRFERKNTRLNSAVL